MEIFNNVDTLVQQEKAAHQRYLDVKVEYEEARANAKDKQAICKDVKEQVTLSRQLRLEKGRRIDEQRSHQTTYGDRIRSLREQAEKLPRNTRLAARSGPQSSSKEGAPTANEHTSAAEEETS